MPSSSRLAWLSCGALTSLAAVVGCRCESAPAPLGSEAEPAGDPAGAGFSAAVGYDPDWRRPGSSSGPDGAAPAPTDPLGGHFGLAEAAAALPPGRRWLATIETELGTLACELWPERAPLAVATFTGLANGLRPVLTREGWRREHAYDGSAVHRVVKGLALYAGKSSRVDRRHAGFVIPDETWPGMRHDRAGLLFMASQGPSTTAMVFGVTLGSAPALDAVPAEPQRRGSNTVIGQCGPATVVAALGAVELRGTRPARPLAIRSVRVTRR